MKQCINDYILCYQEKAILEKIVTVLFNCNFKKQ